MASTMENIRAKIKRRFSHKDPNPVNYDEYDEADEETQAALDKEYEKAQENDQEPYGKPGSLLNKLIMHGNRKTEEEIQRGHGGQHQTAATTTTAGETTGQATTTSTT